jgi:hypothetical protein
MVGDMLRDFELAVVFQVGGDAGRAKGMVSDPGLDAGGGSAALNHPVGVLLPHGVAGESAGLARGRAEQGAVRVAAYAGGGDVLVKIPLQIVMAGNLMLLAAFLVQADPSAASLHEVIANLHLQHGAHARERVNHRGDQRPVAQANQRRFVGIRAAFARRVSLDQDAVEQIARFLGRQHGRLTLLDGVFRAAHGVGRVHVQDVARHQPIEQHTQRGQVLLDGRRGQLPLQILDEGGDVEGFDVGELGNAAAGAPFRETPRRVQVRLARVVIVDLGSEKFENAPGGLRCRREKRRGLQLGRAREDDSGSAKLRGGSYMGRHPDIQSLCRVILRPARRGMISIL